VLTRPLAYAPLVPYAACATVAIIADRFGSVPASAWLLIASVGLALGVMTFRRSPALSLAGLWLGAGGLAGTYHHTSRNDFPADDIGNFAAVEPRLVRIRGILGEEPTFRGRPPDNPLVSRPRTDSSRTTLLVSEVQANGYWVGASGRARLNVEGRLTDLHVGDQVEVTGMLARPAGPMNPGEWDFASRLQDDRIRAEMRVQHTADGIVRLQGGSWGVRRTLAAIRGWGQRGLSERVPRSEGPVAAALLLGDQSAMSSNDWDRYVRTGVVHVLAISGQHLVILGAFLWIVLRVLGVRRRPAAVIVAAALLSYALMTGARPSAVRAAVIACAMCGAILLRTQALPANTFALAWLVVLAINPTDLFTAGFQLSFLCVAVLVWGIPHWFPPREREPLQELLDESRSLPERVLRKCAYLLGRAYLTTLVLGFATAPLVAYWQNLVAPAGVIIGPPAIVLTTVALIAGFLLLFLWPLGPVAAPFAWLVEQSLALCDALIATADGMPGACWYVGPLPVWWAIGFYAMGSLWLLSGVPDRVQVMPNLRWPLTFPLALAGWVVFGLFISATRLPADEMRVTFLAVDHGACVVIESPDGRVLMYDAGATAGPDVTRRQIAPFLWSRGIRRVDEVFLSHGDLDHFNGLPGLIDRFAIGQVTYTPSFPDKGSGGIRVAIAAVERRGIPVRVARAGDRFNSGPVTIDVLHPPPDGPPGVENVRSLVLLLRHKGHSILLTGDLEGAGVDLVTALPPPPIDVLMVPHHGAGGPRVETLAEWARPTLAVSSQGRADAGKAGATFRRRGIPYWSTWPDGAVAVRSHATGLVAESFVSGQRAVVRSGSGP
jgi:competence protein ComEC